MHFLCSEAGIPQGLSSISSLERIYNPSIHPIWLMPFLPHPKNHATSSLHSKKSVIIVPCNSGGCIYVSPQPPLRTFGWSQSPWCPNLMDAFFSHPDLPIHHQSHRRNDQPSQCPSPGGGLLGLIRCHPDFSLRAGLRIKALLLMFRSEIASCPPLPENDSGSPTQILKTQYIRELACYTEKSVPLDKIYIDPKYLLQVCTPQDAEWWFRLVTTRG